MCIEIRLTKSKINLLNGLIAQYNDSGLFNPEEIARHTAPIVLRVQELQQEINELQARECEVVDAEALTPRKAQTENELR